jgi:hypothetical protein
MTLRHILVLFELVLPFPLSRRHHVLGDLPDKALFESEEAPCFAERVVTSI